MCSDVLLQTSSCLRRMVVDWIKHHKYLIDFVHFIICYNLLFVFNFVLVVG